MSLCAREGRESRRRELRERRSAGDDAGRMRRCSRNRIAASLNLLPILKPRRHRLLAPVSNTLNYVLHVTAMFFRTIYLEFTLVIDRVVGANLPVFVCPIDAQLGGDCQKDEHICISFLGRGPS